MLIDWFTVGAQIVNFLILIWLLKRLLYKPILRAIDEREKRVAAQLAEAEARKTEAEKERAGFQSRNEEFDRQRQDLLREASAQANIQRDRLLEAARTEAVALRAKLRESLNAEHDRLTHEIGERFRKETFALTRKTLADLAGVPLEERMMQVLLQRISGMDGPARDTFAHALRTGAHPAVVRSAFDVTPAQRDAFSGALRKMFSTDVPIEFKTTPELVSGIEISANGRKLAWSVSDYLESLEKAVEEFLESETKTVPTP